MKKKEVYISIKKKELGKLLAIHAVRGDYFMSRGGEFKDNLHIYAVS